MKTRKNRTFTCSMSFEKAALKYDLIETTKLKLYKTFGNVQTRFSDFEKASNTSKLRQCDSTL